MNQKKKAFTLIELIIVVVIIGILALVAIPRYFANINKAQKSQVLANLAAIKQAQLAYYAVYGT
jgi:prepilin-type N-terminal cleavage/methylation domain-containing protein